MAVTYYVDFISGVDTNTGLTKTEAWQTLDKVNSIIFQPGDTILFKSGSSWIGTLSLHGSGVADNPIKVGRYDNGPKPLFQGEGKVVNTIELIDGSYWEIEDLEISNAGDPDNYHNGLKVSYTESSQTPPRQFHIYVRRLDIHDVDTFSNSGGGGIRIDAILSDVLIDGCVITRTGGNGIDVHSNYAWIVPKVQSVYDQMAGEDVIIRNCTTSFCGDSGIWVWGYKRVMISHNTAFECNLGTSGRYVGIWIMDTEDAVIQYNNSYRHRKAIDGECIDVDVLCFRTIVQYNYVHDNDNIGIVVFAYSNGEFPTDDVIVRYNVSENCSYAFSLFGDILGDTLWHNNTSYSFGAAHVSTGAFRGSFSGTHRFINNIFYNGGFDLTSDGPGTVVFENNAYYNTNNQPPNDIRAINADPRFVNPGTGGENRDSVDGYKLLSDSPCIDTGVSINDNITTDYWGNPCPIGIRDVGANEFQSFRLIKATSRRTHGVKGNFDIPISIDATSVPPIECRNGTNFTLILTFSKNIVSGSASPVTRAGKKAQLDSITFLGNIMTIKLKNVSDAQLFRVNLSNIQAADGSVLVTAVVRCRVLIGDTNSDNIVNNVDADFVTSNLNKLVTNSNFRADANSSGNITSIDQTVITNHLGNRAPAN
jgi:hypothetical protein